jgi:hypothetical protein
MPVPHCIGCGATRQPWWWWCPEHRVWECESCSQPGAYRSAEQGTHRFSCEVEGVKQVGRRLLVTCTSDRYAAPDGDGAPASASASSAASQ